MSRDKAIGIGFITGVVIATIGLIAWLILKHYDSNGDAIPFLVFFFIILPCWGVGSISVLAGLFSLKGISDIVIILIILTIQGLSGALIGYLLGKYSKNEYRISTWRFIVRITIILMGIGVIISGITCIDFINHLD